MKIEFQAIGVAHSPFTRREGMPIQPSKAEGAGGVVEVFPEYQAGLKDLDGFSHIILLCNFHKSEVFPLKETT